MTPASPVALARNRWLTHHARCQDCQAGGCVHCKRGYPCGDVWACVDGWRLYVAWQALRTGTRAHRRSERRRLIAELANRPRSARLRQEVLPCL